MMIFPTLASSSGISSMYYSDDEEDFINYFGYTNGIFPINRCPQFDGGDDYNRANLDQSWFDNYEDYWYIRFAVVETATENGIATNSECLAATLALDYPQWRFQLANVDPTNSYEPCSFVSCDDDELYIEDYQNKLTYYSTDSDGQ